MSLRTRLVLAVLGLALLPLLLAGFLSDRSVESAFRKDLGTSFTRRAADSSDKVARSLQDAQHALETWASLSFMQEVLTDDLDGKISSFLIGISRKYTSFASLQVLKTTGECVSASDPRFIGEKAQDRELALALEGQLSLGDAHYSEADSQWVVTFAAPIQLEGSVVGVLLGKWKADELSAITQVGSRGESVGVYVLRKDGLVLAGPDPAERYKRNVEAEGAESASRAVKGQQGFVEERLRGRPVLSGFSPFQAEGALASLGWAVLVTQDEAVAFAPIRKMRGWMGGIALALALVIVPLTVLLGRQITGPVIDISRAAQRVARGDFEARVTPRTNDEIGALAKAFNDMTTDLASQRAELVDKHYVDSILASMLDTLVVLDAQGVIKTVNRATTDLLFYEEGDLVGRPGHVLTGQTPEDAERMVATIREKRSFSAPDFSYHTKWGGTVPVSLSASVMRDDKGGVRGIVCIAKDITDLKRQQEELREAKEAAEQANRTKSQFLANMSHELRTPLNAIIGYSEMLYEEAHENGEVALTSDLRKIQSAGKHLLALINDILDLSKIEAGKMELYLEVVDIGALIEDTVVTIEPLVQKNGNILDVSVGEGVGRMKADVTRLRQVLFNLLSNASKFTNKGHIALSVARETVEGREEMVFAVKDTGIGLTKEHISRLFQAFAQADATTTRKFGGTGLGLVISRRFCQIMGGDITVESEYGHGTTFTVRIPAEAAETKMMAASGAMARKLSGPRTAPTAAITKTGTVLVIDDDATVQDLVARIVSKDGFDVVMASTGDEGLRLAKELKPSVITLDVMMPGMDGWSVLGRLKADIETAHIPVVMLTLVDDKNLGFALGAADYVTKPVDKTRLLAILRKYRTGGGPGSLLVVDDDPQVRGMMRRQLEKEGYTVAEAVNGREGLERLAENRPDLVLLDLMMPEMDGFEFVSEMRKTASWRSIPVVVVTAMELGVEERRWLQGSVEAVLQKSAFSREELEQEIRALLTAH